MFTKILEIYCLVYSHIWIGSLFSVKSSFNQVVTLQMCENRLFAWISLFLVISQSVNLIVIYFAFQTLLEFALQTETKMRIHCKQAEIEAHEFWCLDSEYFDMIMISFSKWKYQSQNDHERSLIPHKKWHQNQVDEDGFVQHPSRGLFRHYRKSIILVTSHRKVSLAPNLEFAQILCMHKTIDV